MLTQTQKEKIKAQAITELFNSKQLQEKILGICIRHGIPTNADIESDILQVALENLWKYDTNKFVEAWVDKPNRILALGVRIILTKCIYKDKRIPKGWNHSIAQQIIHQLTLTEGCKHISSTIEAGDEGDDNNIPQIASNDDYEAIEAEQVEMWNYIKAQLNRAEKKLLKLVLSPVQPKFKGQEKKDYQALLPKLKTIITQYQNLN